MATQYTSLLGLALPVTGELTGTWGDVVNDSITQLVEDSVANYATADVTSGNWTLTTTGSGATNQARMMILRPTGTPGVPRNIIAPSYSKLYIVVNTSDDAVVLKGSATTGATIQSNVSAVCAWTGSDFEIISDITGPDGATNNAIATFDGSTGKIIKDSGFTMPVADGTAGQLLATDGAGNLDWSNGAPSDVTAGKSITLAMIFGF